MSKIIKAQNGLSFAIPIIRTLSQVFPRIGVLPGMFRSPKEVVVEKELNNAFRTYACVSVSSAGSSFYFLYQNEAEYIANFNFLNSFF